MPPTQEHAEPLDRSQIAPCADPVAALALGRNPAPGYPGIPARWTSSAKSGVGTALRARSRVWFTLSHGILNEVYFPRIDQACTRDFGLIVTDGRHFFSEQKRNTRSVIQQIEHGVPAFAVTSTCVDGRYIVTKFVLSDPRVSTAIVGARRVAEIDANNALSDAVHKRLDLDWLQERRVPTPEEAASQQPGA